jgi:hypothetical protein
MLLIMNEVHSNPQFINAKNLIAVSFLIIALSIGYYFVVFLPNKEREKQESDLKIETAKLEREQAKKRDLEYCIEVAHDHYISNWNLGCKGLGKKDECELPGRIAEGVTKVYNDGQELCVKEYK